MELSEKKCHQLHVGKLSDKCQNLKVNQSILHKATSERYLGDIISSDGKNDRNILDRYNKGIGHANQILGILKEISFGKYYFEQALQLRNAKLINGMLCSIESMYGLNLAQIEKLEKCDRYFFRKIFNSPYSTPIESFYMETNTLPLRFVIIGRRLLYYWTIINKPENELVKQILKTQQISPVRNDWCNTVSNDLQMLDIDIDEEKIAAMKKSKFKSLVLGRIKQAAAEFLADCQNKHSKSANLKVNSDMQRYLLSHDLTTQEKQILFSLRTRTFPCKANYSNQYFSLKCDFCGKIDDQEHLLQCVSPSEIDTSVSQYKDIFGTLTQQIRIAKIMKRIADKRKYLNISSSDGSRAHQP